MVMTVTVVPQVIDQPTAIAQEEEVGRWVDLGPWNGVADCESSPNSRADAILTDKGVPLAPEGTRKARREIRIDQEGASRDRGAFQFIPSTWDWVARSRGQHHLVGRDPRTTTLATQLRQAEWLRINGGIGHWTCGYRYNDGTPPQYVTAEIRQPSKPVRCTRNLHNVHDFSWKISRSVCNRPGYLLRDFA